MNTPKDETADASACAPIPLHPWELLTWTTRHHVISLYHVDAMTLWLIIDFNDELLPVSDPPSLKLHKTEETMIRKVPKSTSSHGARLHTIYHSVLDLTCQSCRYPCTFSPRYESAVTPHFSFIPNFLKIAMGRRVGWLTPGASAWANRPHGRPCPHVPGNTRLRMSPGRCNGSTILRFAVLVYKTFIPPLSVNIGHNSKRLVQIGLEGTEIAVFVVRGAQRNIYLQTNTSFFAMTLDFMPVSLWL